MILVTGAGGTLGRAFIDFLGDARTIALDNAEWPLAEMEHPRKVLADYAEWDTPVDTIVHCAAYKHVDIGEGNPSAFVSNNITKLEGLLKKSRQWNARFLFVSTDKAVEPCSLYGMTKAIGEKLTWHYGGQVARCGNILASNGSVIPVWQKAIAEGKPIRVTDWRMKRYVISAQDAVKQMWCGFQAGQKLIIPLMEEVTLAQLVERVAPGHPTEVIGMRPGERLEERLTWPHE